MFAPRYYAPRRAYYPRYNVGGHYIFNDYSRVIYDYHLYGLYDPPHGYHWVYDHDRQDAILASVATGAIIGLVIGALSY